MIEDYKQLQEQKKEIESKLRKLVKKSKNTLQKEFHKAFKDLFAKYPLLEEISFKAYTPYFNDGEACNYRSTHDYPDITYDGQEYEDGYELPDQKCKKELFALMSSIGDELIEDIFGDHVRITIQRDKILVETYENHS